MSYLYFHKILLLVLFFYLPFVYGEIYKTVDEDGNIIFTDIVVST